MPNGQNKPKSPVIGTATSNLPPFVSPHPPPGPATNTSRFGEHSSPKGGSRKRRLNKKKRSRRMR